MIVQPPKRPDLIILLPLMLLTACAEEPSYYAPVQTVNQALEPTNGYYLRKKSPVSPDIEPNNIQQPTTIITNEQGLRKIAQNPEKTEESFPVLQRQQPVETRSTDISANKAAAKSPTIPTQANSNQDKLAQKPTKNKSAASAPEKNQSSKPLKLAMIDHEASNILKNKPIKSISNGKSTQKSQRSDAKTLDNVQLTGKNIKKSIISIDNKKMLKLNFQWPLLGKVARNFSQTDSKGILIKGKTGQTVHAAEAGKAVYCGNGLAGFGNLAIIKHNETYLSAYANNSKLFIKEGEQVEKGQTIGQVGQTGLKKFSLHFEIRKNGKPINPLTVLPKH